MPTNVWVTVHPNGWAVKREGSERATQTFSTQAEAIAHGRALAKKDKVEFILQGRDGQIRERDSYGNDPYPPKG